MCKADLLAVAQLEKECFAEAWSENALAESLAEANYVFFVAVVSKPSCMADEKDTEEIVRSTSVHIWQQMNFLSQMSLYFHHTDGAAQLIS